MRLLALVLTMWMAAGTAARADLPSPFGWLRGNESSAATKSTTWTGGRATAAVTKMAKTPQRLVTRTKNMLTPKKTAKKKSSELGVVSVEEDDSEVPRQGFLGRLFNPEPETSPATVNEWMALEKPKFGGSRSIR